MAVFISSESAMLAGAALVRFFRSRPTPKTIPTAGYARTFAALCDRPFPAGDEGNQEQDEEKPEADFRDQGGGAGHNSEAKEARDERDNEEGNCVG